MIVDTDGAGAPAKFQSRTLKVARFCAREEVGAAEVAGEEVDLPNARLRTGGLGLGNQRGPADVDGNMDVDEDDRIDTSSTSDPEGGSGEIPEAIPAPDSLSLSVQHPPPRGSVERRLDPGSSFDKLRQPSQVPKVTRTQDDEMTRDQLRDECSQRGFWNKESNAVLQPSLTKMDAAGEKRNLERSASQDTPVCGRGIRERAPGNGVMGSDITRQSFGKAQLDGERERAPTRRVKVSDIPARISGKHSLDGRRERAPAKGGEGSR